MLAIVASTSAFGSLAEPWALTGKVINVADGDSLTLMLEDFSKVSVRLSDIDAPESGHGQRRPGQPFSNASRQALSALVKGQQASATCYEIDNPKYKRSVCTVVVNGVNVNAEQLRLGMAWANRASPRYVRDSQSYVLEQQAKAAGRGLWSKNALPPIEPWVWRDQCWKKNACAGAGE